MRQILLSGSGAVVARVPRPAIEPGSVLVRVHYSLISVGTEIAPLRTPTVESLGSAAERTVAYADRVRHYARASIRDPRKAINRVTQIVRAQARRLVPARPAPPRVTPTTVIGEISWSVVSPLAEIAITGGGVSLVTDDTPAGYQMMSQAIAVRGGETPLVRVEGTVEAGAIAIGLLNSTRDRWLGTRVYQSGPIDDTLIFDAAASHEVTVVVTTAGAPGRARATFTEVAVSLSPRSEGGLPLSELDTIGWNVGYSAAGEVVAVGDGVSDLAVGDLVACAGAGQANHADFISVKRNLVCRVPHDCPLDLAASTTVGTIALQGVRRAAPQLGERVAVLGLGLIGQMTTQLLRAAGCEVVGLDLEAARVDRAKRLGMAHGASESEAFKTLVRDVTSGRGVDQTIMTAATKSHAVINLAMEVTRAKGRVVIVGDVGLNVQRDIFYRKEIDLLMSSSYGPGRYDPSYEVDGLDYPVSHVRWTLNRNMQAYLELVAKGRLDIRSLIDQTISVVDAPAAYQTLAHAAAALPLGVLIRYPDDVRALPEPSDSTRVVIRGHRRPPAQPVLNVALVGAGAFGTSMLVPQMSKRRDRFFLKAVVSRHASQGGNFARENRVEIFASDLDAVLRDPSIDLLVIATRHHEHADQVVRALEAGKHVFVEKPLAMSWAELERVNDVNRPSNGSAPLLLVGFNRRFSPALAAVKNLLSGRRAPLVIEYRLNGGYIPLDSWVQGPQGGGRNIGEACHMYDVFRFLTDAPAMSVNAAAIDPRGLPYRRNDNFSATITYEDGSLAHLLYTALGPKTGLGKERIEVFCDGETFLVDDFKQLVRTSDGATLWQGDTDKGHFEELSRFGDAIASGGPSPVPFDQLIETTAVALHVEDVLFGRSDGLLEGLHN